MNNVFDIIEAIGEKIEEFFGTRGFLPSAILVSPGSYRRLVEIQSCVEELGSLVIGCTPLTELATERGLIKVVVDEMLNDTTIEIEDKRSL